MALLQHAREWRICAATKQVRGGVLLVDTHGDVLVLCMLSVHIVCIYYLYFHVSVHIMSVHIH